MSWLERPGWSATRIEVCNAVEMKKKLSPQATKKESSSWRDIAQNVKDEPVTEPARERRQGRTLRVASWIFFLALVIGGVGTGIWYVDRGRETVGVAVKANPIEEIVLLTDGVLSDEWINQRLQIPPEAGLMEVDIQSIKDRLEAEGQVASATITRRFPSTLVVNLNERTPVARLVTQGAESRPVVYLVAVDGVLYHGIGYAPELIQRIPFLDGVRLSRRGEGFAPLPRLDDVAALFSLAEQIAPHLVRDWRIVALDRRPFIVLRTREVNEIVFEPGSYRQQLARLDYILDFYRQTPDEKPARIDLSFRNQASVELAAGNELPRTNPDYPGN